MAVHILPHGLDPIAVAVPREVVVDEKTPHPVEVCEAVAGEKFYGHVEPPHEGILIKPQLNLFPWLDAPIYNLENRVWEV
jgi:hypothetical protein